MSQNEGFPKIDKGVYRHSKTNNLYEVLGVALQTETRDPLVIYRPLYQSDYELFARPLEMFRSKVELEAKTVPRFEKIDR